MLEVHPQPGEFLLEVAFRGQVGGRHGDIDSVLGGRTQLLVGLLQHVSVPRQRVDSPVRENDIHGEVFVVGQPNGLPTLPGGHPDEEAVRQGLDLHGLPAPGSEGERGVVGCELRFPAGGEQQGILHH